MSEYLPQYLTNTSCPHVHYVRSRPSRKYETTMYKYILL